MKATNEYNDSSPSALPFWRAIAVGIAVIFAILYWPSIRGYYLTAQAAKAPVMPSGDGGGETLESMPADTPPELGLNEIVVTDINPTPIADSFVVTDKVPLAASSGIQWNTIEDAAKQQGKHVITQAEVEEVLLALINARSDAAYAAAALRFVGGGGITEAQKTQLEMADDAIARAEKLNEMIAKWAARVQEGKK